MKIMDTHYTGAASEMTAAAWFLSEGYQVYMPVCQQGEVDFVIQKDQSLSRVQVKTATWVTSGNHKYLQCRIRLTNKYQDYEPVELYDWLFINSPDGQWLIPAGEIKSSNLSLMNTGKNKCQWTQYKL